MGTAEERYKTPPWDQLKGILFSMATPSLLRYFNKVSREEFLAEEDERRR